MGCFYWAEGCAEFMCVLRGPVSDLDLVPLGYKARVLDRHSAEACRGCV